MKISGGRQEKGIIVGNSFDKYSSKNPVVRLLMRGFSNNLSELMAKSAPISIHEIGCGEGYWTLQWKNQGFKVRGTDFSEQVIDIARSNAELQGASPDIFSVRSIFDLDPHLDCADLIVCCEVLEHLENPKLGLIALQKVVRKYLILSVPREPIWRLLNLTRGKYISTLGNTPGHIQHWSTKKIIRFVSIYFEVVEVRTPLPWTMLLCRPHL